MDVLTFAVPQLHVAINCLLEAAGDKDEAVRKNVSSSLRRIAKKYAVHVLQNAVAYRQKNPKLSVSHLTTVLTVMEHICEEQGDQLDDIVTKQLSTYCVDEMTKCAEYLPAIQFPVSNTLVALGQRNCSIVMGDLVTKLHSDSFPHYTVLHTMANLASANVAGFVPFIKATLDMLLPLMPSVRNEPIRQVFSFALGKFSEAILEFLSTRPEGEGDITVSVTKEAFTEEITTAYEILLMSWLHSRESKIVENVVVAVGPMFPLVDEARQPEFAQRTVSVLLNLYRRSQPPAVAPHPITQCLASILQAAPTSAIEPLYDQLISVLGAMVVTPPDYTNPQTVKNHSEVLRCYDRLGCHFPERMADLLVRQLASGSERDRVEALIVAAHLLSGSENVLQPRVADITSALRLLLSTNSVKIKKALVKTIVSLACRGNAEDGSDFVEFLVRHCCPSTFYSGPEWEELTAMCCSTVYLLSSTVSEVQHLLWSVLLRLLLIPEYDAACAMVARSLAHLAAKQIGNNSTQNGGVPSPAAVFTRCIALLGSPLNANRGPHLLTFLMHYCPILQPILNKIWTHKIPQLINYLEVSEWSESQWEALLLEFVSTSLQAADSEDWVILIANHLSAQLVRNPPTAVVATAPSDERGMLLKCLALASCCLSDRQIITSHLDVMLSPLRHYSPSDSKACARGVGLLARVHLNLVLTRLEAATQSELSRRPSRLLGLMKDPRADLEVERARVAILRCYAEVASQAPASALLPRLDDGLMAWLITQLSQAKDATAREAAMLTVANIADTLDRHRDTYTENLKSRDQLLTTLINLIQNSSSPDSLTLRVTAAVVKLPPELSMEVRSSVLRTCFDRVFTSDVSENSVEEKPPDSNPVIKNLGILVEELLIDDVSLATLDDISTLLEPWLVQRNTQQRAAAVYILKTTLQAYYHHMTFGYEHPSKFSQAGVLLGRSVLRCLDEDMTVRAAALDCARFILLISAKYESLSSADLELSQAFSDMSMRDSCVNEELAKIVASKLPQNQLSHFSDTLLRGLSDMEPTQVDSVSDILACFFQAKGGELYHHINDIIVLLLTRLAVLNPSSRGGAVKALLALARHHPKAVVNTLLAQPLPLHTSICDCWKALSTDPALAADIIDQFLRLIKSTPLLNEDTSSSNRNRPSVAVLLPFAAVSAMREMFLVASMHELAMAYFAELFSLLLTVFATYVGVTPPVYSPASNKTVFIPNREAYKINPSRVAQDSLKNFLLCSRYDAVAEAVVESSQTDMSSSFDYFLTMIPPLTKAICTSCGHQLPKILSALGSHYSNSLYEAQRAAVTAFNSQCVELQCGGQSALIDGVLSSLLTSLCDSAVLVRRLSLKGLANISYLDSSQRERHCESVLEALIQGLDDHDTECHGEVALEAMLGLSQVLPSVPQARVRDIQVAIALRIKPFFDKENVELRTMSLRLLGELAVTGGEALPGFQDQVRASLVCLLLHLRDPEPSVVKACKFSLRAVSNVLEAEKTKAMMNQHLIDDASLHFQEFISDLAKLLVEEMTDQMPMMITTSLSYGKSLWPPIRASSTLFIGALFSSSPSYVRERVSLEAITLRLQQQIKDPEKEVRSAASYAFSLLFISPT